MHRIVRLMRLGGNLRRQHRHRVDLEKVAQNEQKANEDLSLGGGIGAEHNLVDHQTEVRRKDGVEDEEVHLQVAIGLLDHLADVVVLGN